MNYSSSIAFAVALLLFLLPFVEIKCNSTSLYKAKGIELVTGFTVKDDKGKNSDDSIAVNDNSNERQEPNSFAVVAFVLGILGLILSFANFRSRPVISAITGLLAAICLIAMLIQIRSDVGNWSMTGERDPHSDLFKDMTRTIKITAQFTAWYYLSVISFLAAAFFSYRKKPFIISN